MCTALQNIQPIKPLELYGTEFYDGGASTDGRQTSLMPIMK